MKKNFISGVVTGALIFGALGVFAGQYVANPNPFPIQLNGENVSMEGYNIDGSTYFKLRDIAAVIGGFDVDFKNNTIQLSKDGYVYADPDAALKDFAKNNVKSVVNEEINIAYTNVKFKIADVTGDGVNDLLALGIEDDGTAAQIEVYSNQNGKIQSIFNSHCGAYNGGYIIVTPYNGRLYMCGCSYSSSTGFNKNLLKYENGDWNIEYSCKTVFDWETGNIVGYDVNGTFVSETEYENFDKSLEENALTSADFSYANEL